jgi:hypothetical protein
MYGQSYTFFHKVILIYLESLNLFEMGQHPEFKFKKKLVSWLGSNKTWSLWSKILKPNL